MRFNFYAEKEDPKLMKLFRAEKKAMKGWKYEGAGGGNLKYGGWFTKKVTPGLYLQITRVTDGARGIGGWWGELRMKDFPDEPLVSTPVFDNIVKAMWSLRKKVTIFSQNLLVAMNPPTVPIAKTKQS